MERVVECPHCGSEDHCFEEMQDEYSSFMCFNCGFMSDSRFTAENEAKIAADSSILVNKLKFWEEERGIWWFPAVVNMGKLGIIFPEGTEEEWVWKYAKAVPVPEEKKAQVGDYKMMLDTENAQSYDKFDFLSACQDMGIARDIKNG